MSSSPKIEAIGHVTAFFARPSAAVIQLTAPLRVGELVYIKGHVTDFQQPVTSLQLAKRSIPQAEAGQLVGVRVQEKCRKHDVVYRLTWEE
ncbi:MAG: translation elongation factor-like protein [Candidatus Omnitrophica bacterium]|nr:translation elongation factor-like protein [Candidatus Omnitrophota bacterium]